MMMLLLLLLVLGQFVCKQAASVKECAQRLRARVVCRLIGTGRRHLCVAQLAAIIIVIVVVVALAANCAAKVLAQLLGEN